MYKNEQKHAKWSTFMTKGYTFIHTEGVYFVKEKSILIVNRNQSTFRHCFEYYDFNWHDKFQIKQYNKH